MIPFQLHRRIPLVRRPFYQRDMAIAQRDQLAQELVEARNALVQHGAERDAAIADCDRLARELGEARNIMSECGVKTNSHLRQLPWYSVDLPWQVADGRGMIFDDERRLLYILARDYFTGTGRIIDGGTFIGDSSLALGYGLKDRGYPPKPVIDAFDQFIIDDLSVGLVRVETDAAGHAIKGGDNIQFVYEGRTAAVADYIQINAGDVTAAPWTGGPIEILFSDLSKSWGLNDYIIQNWFPSLIPERGILIQQDQVQEYHVWVGITMELLAEHFECIDYVKNSSMVYRLRRAVPSTDLQRSLSHNVSTDDMERAYLSYLERFTRIGMGRYKGWHLGMVEAGLVVTYAWHIGDKDKARFAWAACEKKFRDVPDTIFRLREIKQHLDDGTPCPGAKL